MPRARTSSRTVAAATAFALLSATRIALAQDAAATVLPALGAVVDVPDDGRHWSLSTRIDGHHVTVLARVGSGAASLAVTMRHARGEAGSALSCEQLVEAQLRVGDLAPFAVAQPVVFRGAPFESTVWQQRNATHEAEFGCVQARGATWLVIALARPGATVGLEDARPMARALARSIVRDGIRGDYPVTLAASSLELDDPHDGEPWWFHGTTSTLPAPSDLVATGGDDAGGVTLTVARTGETCAVLADRLRTTLRDAGTLVDRPGYVPDAFGPRVRRIVGAERTREIYCAAITGRALLVTAVFRNDDAEAMSRIAPMARALVVAAERGVDRTPAH